VLRVYDASNALLGTFTTAEVPALAAPFIGAISDSPNIVRAEFDVLVLGVSYRQAIDRLDIVTAQPTPARVTTWGALKSLYRP
jgi:hypothetical protein